MCLFVVDYSKQGESPWVRPVREGDARLDGPDTCTGPTMWSDVVCSSMVHSKSGLLELSLKYAGGTINE